ncbi:unnamed protein product, partial [marine sediment metagenome]
LDSSAFHHSEGVLKNGAQHDQDKDIRSRPPGPAADEDDGAGADPRERQEKPSASQGLWFQGPEPARQGVEEGQTEAKDNPMGQGYQE